MKINILKNETYNSIDTLPKKGTSKSTGFDIVCTSGPLIVGEKAVLLKNTQFWHHIDYIEYRTNLRMSIQNDKVLTWTVKDDKWVEIPIETNFHDVLLFPRSSISKYNLQLANGVGLADNDYSGEVLLRFNYVWNPMDFKITKSKTVDEFGSNLSIVGTPNINKLYKKGDKICQLKITKVEDVEFSLVDSLDITERNEGGFGSTGK